VDKQLACPPDNTPDPHTYFGLMLSAGDKNNRHSGKLYFTDKVLFTGQFAVLIFSDIHIFLETKNLLIKPVYQTPQITI